MPQEFKPLSVGNNVTVIPCVEPVKKIVWIFVMIFSKCLLNRYFIFSLNPPPFFLPQNGTFHYRFLPSKLSIPETRAILSQISHSGVIYGKA